MRLLDPSMLTFLGLPVLALVLVCADRPIALFIAYAVGACATLGGLVALAALGLAWRRELRRRRCPQANV